MVLNRPNLKWQKNRVETLPFMHINLFKDFFKNMHNMIEIYFCCKQKSGKGPKLYLIKIIIKTGNIVSIPAISS